MNHSSHVVHKIISWTRGIALSLRLVYQYIYIYLYSQRYNIKPVNNNLNARKRDSLSSERIATRRVNEQWYKNENFSSHSLRNDSVSLAVHKLAYRIPHKSQISLHFHASLVSSYTRSQFRGQRPYNRGLDSSGHLSHECLTFCGGK